VICFLPPKNSSLINRPGVPFDCDLMSRSSLPGSQDPGGGADLLSATANATLGFAGSTVALTARMLTASG
jgi:hypothetical protein